MGGEGLIIKNRASNYSIKTRLAEHVFCFSHVGKDETTTVRSNMGFLSSALKPFHNEKQKREGKKGKMIHIGFEA